MGLKSKEALGIFTVGFVVSFMFFFMIQVLFAVIMTDYIIGALDDISILYIIVFFFQFLSIGVSAFTGYLIMRNKVLSITLKKALFMSFLLSFTIVLIMSYVSLFLRDMTIFSIVRGIEIILIFPKVIVMFGVYVLGDFFILYLFNIIFYNAFFIFFIDSYYETKFGG